MSTIRDKISKPRHDGKYPDRNIDCQEAVAAGVVDLIEAAENAGWSTTEAARAVNEVSHGLIQQATGRIPDE
ncbi:hypothetical protein [Brucella pseudogrignonensis]|uniref:Uncharacterized protein n=1 Tax=Brucella pseudogrignonensis TaxID=419475 RepID=A0ABU1M5E1_9HYPH|nr:hypothetical protein [Brucella pseudogrignonensis]MDR6431273.1 hypothetical protein [Brucella pseudogrignonensis]